MYGRWFTGRWAPYAVSLVHFALGAPRLLTFENGSHPDEATYLAVSSALNWAEPFTPRLEAVPVFFKPPALYWIQSASLHLFGWHLWAARLPSLVATAALGLVLFHVSRTAGRLPFRAALLLESGTLASVCCLRFGTLGMMDALFSLCLLGQLAALAHRPAKKRHLVLAAIAQAGAILLKGPIGLLLGAGFSAAYALVFRHRPGRWRRAMLGVVTGALLAAPWFVVEAISYGDEFLAKFLLHEHVAKMQGARSLAGELQLVLLPLLVALPWAFGFRRPGRSPWLRLSAWACVVVVGAYALQSSRQLHYGMPAAPFMISLTLLARPVVPIRLLGKGVSLVAIALGVCGLAIGPSEVRLAVLVLATGLLLFGRLLSNGNVLSATMAFAGLWTLALGVCAPLLLPARWPTELAARAGGEPVWEFGEDTGVAALQSGANLHRSYVASEHRDAPPGLWVHQVGAPPQSSLFRWKRLRTEVAPLEVLEALRSASLDGLTEEWELSRCPATLATAKE